MCDPALKDLVFDGDQENLWVYGGPAVKSRDPVVARIYWDVLDDIENIHKYRVKSKRKMHYYTYHHVCYACRHVIHPGDWLDGLLFNCSGQWRRLEVHACCAVPKEKHALVPLENKSARSGKVLLLLLELGLPYDLAWPIAAAACWLL